MSNRGQNLSLLLTYRCDEEIAAKAQIQKTVREIETNIVELQEDLEAEKSARTKAEKQKRDLNEELEALKNELLDSLDSTATQQELRTKREMELAHLKRTVEEEGQAHEGQLTEIRHKQNQMLENLNEQLETVKKSKLSLEKNKSILEAENADMANDIKTIMAGKQESERRRKQLEQHLQEISIRFSENERGRGELAEKVGRMTVSSISSPCFLPLLFCFYYSNLRVELNKFLI